MATYYSNRSSSNGSHEIKGGFGMISDYCEVSVGTALVNNDIIKLFTLPKGARVIAMTVLGQGVQSGADSVFDVGDSGDQDRIMGGQTTLRSSSYASYWWTIPTAKSATTAPFHVYTANTDIELKITTAGTGMTTGGKIVAGIIYFLE